MTGSLWPGTHGSEPDSTDGWPVAAEGPCRILRSHRGLVMRPLSKRRNLMLVDDRSNWSAGLATPLAKTKRHTGTDSADCVTDVARCTGPEIEQR